MTGKKRILVLGDSLCLPRVKPEKVSLYQTWPHLLINDHFEVLQLGIGGGTLRDLCEQSAYYHPSEPDIVIIQSGIVDCAPRALGRIEKDIINSNRILNSLFHRLLPVKFIRRVRRKTYTNVKEFQSSIDKITNRFSDSHIIWIGIVPVSKEYEETVPGIAKNIEKYNCIIKNNMINTKNSFCSVNSIPIDGIMSDHHHLSSIGHTWIFQQISILLSKNSK
mgnify:CR=1 FL=1|jgi:hypothetical protein